MAPEQAANLADAVGSFVSNNAFPAFVAFWFMYKTNGKFDRLAKAMSVLTRVMLLSPGFGCDEATKQQLLSEIQDI